MQARVLWVLTAALPVTVACSEPNVSSGGTTSPSTSSSTSTGGSVSSTGTASGDPSTTATDSASASTTDSASTSATDSASTSATDSASTSTSGASDAESNDEVTLPEAGAPPGSKTPGEPDRGALAIDPTVVVQTMDGFGAADVWLPALSDAQADMFFDPNKGIGLSMLRIGISDSGTSMSQWSNAQKAQARGAKIWAAPWSPPASLKDNDSLDNGGHLIPSDYNAWATTLAGFVATANAQSVTISAISVQNEPDFSASYSSCLYTAAQMVSFVNVLGPMLHALNPPVKLIAAEPDVWADLWGGANAYAAAILADANASTNVDILATHQYANGAVSAPPSIPSQPIWETEAGGVPGSIQAGPSADIANGLAVAGWIYDAIRTGHATAWHYWWLISSNADNEGLLLKGGGMTKRFSTMGNFSKFVRPGYVLASASSNAPSGVLVLAFQSPTDGTTAIVAINTNTTATPASFFVGGRSWPAYVTPWETSATFDLAAQTPIPVSGGNFAATLDPQSVTTFVGVP